MVWCADCGRDEVVFVPNATVGINTVVQSVLRTLHKGDSILMLSLAYGKLLCWYVCTELPLIWMDP